MLLVRFLYPVKTVYDNAINVVMTIVTFCIRFNSQICTSKHLSHYYIYIFL